MNNQKSSLSLFLYTSGRRQTINKEQNKLAKDKHCRKTELCKEGWEYKVVMVDLMEKDYIE